MYTKPHKFKIPLYLIIAFIGIILIFSLGVVLIVYPNNFDFFIKDNLDINVEQNSEYKYLSNNEKGDFFGGITNPLIALVGVIVTGLAFYMQYQANQIIQKQIKAEKKANKIIRFESKFYELLQYHKENSKNLIFKDKSYKINLKGKNVINYFIENVNSFYWLTGLMKNFSELNHQERFKLSYLFLFYGIDNKKLNNILVRLNQKTGLKLPKELIDFSKLEGDENIEKNYSNPYLKYNLLVEEHDFDTDQHYDVEVPQYSNYINKFSRLGFYDELYSWLKNLYVLIKFVCKNEDLNYHQKREYIRIIRAQLTPNEQTLIYYNWLSGLGDEWEHNNHNKRPLDDGNFFLTNYRIIHNINADIIIQKEGISLDTVFKEDYLNFLIENDKPDDEYLFDSILIKRTMN